MGPASPAGRQHDGRPEEADRNRHRDVARLADRNGNCPEAGVCRRVDRPSAERKPARGPQTGHESQEHRCGTGEVDPERRRRPRPASFSRRFRRHRFGGNTCHGGMRNRRSRRGRERPRIPLSGLHRGRLSRWRQRAACAWRHRDPNIRHDSGQRRHQQHRNEHDHPCGVAGRGVPHSRCDQHRRNKGRHHQDPHGGVEEHTQHHVAHERPSLPPLPLARRARRSRSSTESTSSSTIPTRNRSAEPAQNRSMMRRTADAAMLAGG